VDCTTYRELLSAALDGEATSLEETAGTSHVAGCSECRAWQASAISLTRSTRLRPADTVPDLTAEILAAVPVVAPEPALDPLPVARIGLALVALAQLVVGQTSLLDAGSIATHLAREQGVWEVALATGFATAAWQPRRAAGLVPLVTALVLGLFVTASVDAAGGAVAVWSEGHHLVAVIGLTLLVAASRLSAVPRRLASS
jgi:predicted anti-sigma-YlaC factor YlaD